MLATTDDEIKFVTEFMDMRAPDEDVTLIQKMYSENVHGTLHEIYDVHTDKERWWVITDPMNMYSQEQFPNMDIALTFHIGLMFRVLRAEKERAGDVDESPFVGCFRQLEDASDALSQAMELSDFQAIGVRCRETLLAFTDASQRVFPWASQAEKPKKADFKAWVDHVCTVMLSGETHENRRHLFKTVLDASWKFNNWLTHAKGATWHDAESAVASTDNAISLCMSAIYRHMRGEPERCPVCGSSRLERQHAHNPEYQDEIWERPACQKCPWTGAETVIKPSKKRREKKAKVKGECSIQTVPLRKIKQPGRS